MVLDEIPDEEEIEYVAREHLEDFPTEYATARCEVVYEPPSWLNIAEQDQMSAYLRDGAACILVIYMYEEESEDFED